ncbi:sulfotransferase family protein [Halochromatium roseum]|uniref:sulfotransferase family protein n=1 Tax=Halochromatium roseum TaxID=391920 RepID=UPI00191234A2|nr:sulfotransferase family protein [Halochromatium roseum]MBK5938452.1 sulfotransferase family protein [Halochromatium roseum]
MTQRISENSRFHEAIDDALELLHDYADQATGDDQDLALPLPSLLEQCQQLLAEAGVHEPPPVRTLHHLACTGGTLISRCLAAQPNSWVLSEVDPLSPFVPGGFLPTDLIGLSRFSSRPASIETQAELFCAGLRVLYEQAIHQGQQLILRDHSHGQFNFGEAVVERPTLRELVSRNYPVLSVISVRHPLDSYLSLQETGWVQHFSPPTLAEYARRYLSFLDAYDDCEFIRYEDFVASPDTEMARLCSLFGLSFDPDFQQTFSAIHLSGDSGRRGDVIRPRPRRAYAPSLVQEAKDAEPFMTLLDRLDYAFDLD